MCLWQNRNELIFQGKRNTSAAVAKKILNLAAVIHQSLSDLPNRQVSSVQNKLCRNIRWEPPDHNWVKLNCDGSVTDLGERSGVGGVFRNSSGDFLLGFAANMGSLSITEAELWAMFMGICLANLHGFGRVIIDSDSLTAVRLINSGCSSLHPAFNLVNDIHSHMIPGSMQISHIWRDANQVADCMAKFGLNLDQCSQLFRRLPNFAGIPFNADLSGTYFPRGF